MKSSDSFFKNIIDELRVKKFLNEDDKVSPWIERKIDDSLRAKIIAATNFLADESTPLKFRIFFLLNGIDRQPTCGVCGKPVTFDAGKKRFQEFCSIDCAGKSVEVKKRREKTNLERYGDSSNFASISKEDRIKNSKKAQVASVESIKRTYGVSNVMHIAEVKEKHREKMNSKETLEKRAQSIKASCLNRYGVDHHSRKDITNFEKYDDREFIVQNFVENEKFLFQQFLDFFNIEFSTGHHRKFELGIEYPNINDWKYGKKQGEVFDFVRSVYSGKIIQNDRSVISPMELDFVIPEQSLAIEFNGTYWHSNLEDKKYHLKKTKLCEDAGYQLFHIFENEWTDSTKQTIWKSMISNRLGLNKTKIGARKCEIREVSSKDAEMFLNENHIQGSSVSSIRLGLYDKNEELVSLMTFIKSRFDKNFDFEVARFCNKTFVSVVGAFSRLLSHFQKIHSTFSLVSYANRRWTSSNKNVYKSNGAQFISSSDPNYFYVKGNEIHSRLEFQKHKLKNILKEYDENLSERQNCINNGYRAIYDSGNLKYTLSSSINNNDNNITTHFGEKHTCQ